jgi:hypothetical protein
MISFYEITDTPDLYYSVAYPNKPIKYKKLSFSHIVDKAVMYVTIHGEQYFFNVSDCKNKWLMTNEEKGFVLKKTEKEIIEICMDFNDQLKHSLLVQLDSTNKFMRALDYKLKKYTNIDKLIERI